MHLDKRKFETKNNENHSTWKIWNKKPNKIGIQINKGRQKL